MREVPRGSIAARFSADGRRLVSTVGLAMMILAIARPASSSWLSDITGVNIDIPAGQVTFGPPRPDRIPAMLQHLPQDVSQFFLSPHGTALAFAIRQAKALAAQDCQAVPADISATLARFFPPGVFGGVCWNVYGQRFAIDSALIQDFNAGAVTLEDVIVFKDYDAARDPVLWAHELTHVQQYRHLGLETFAFMYSYQAMDMENEAYSYEAFVRQNLANQGQQFWSASPGWSPQSQITNAQYSSAAQQVINPFVCSGGWAFVPGGIRLNNNCPIPIRVVTLDSQNLMTGQIATFPCELQQCTVPPGMYSIIPEAAPWHLRSANIVW